MAKWPENAAGIRHVVLSGVTCRNLKRHPEREVIIYAPGDRQDWTVSRSGDTMTIRPAARGDNGGAVTNIITGNVQGSVVQARTIHGPVGFSKGNIAGVRIKLTLPHGVELHQD